MDAADTVIDSTAMSKSQKICVLGIWAENDESYLEGLTYEQALEKTIKDLNAMTRWEWLAFFDKCLAKKMPETAQQEGK